MVRFQKGFSVCLISHRLNFRTIFSPANSRRPILCQRISVAISQFSGVQKLLLDGPCKEGIANATYQPHSKSPISASVKLLLVLGILLCSIAFTIAAIIKAQSIKRACKARSWKLTTFQRLDFTCDDVLDSLKEDNIIGKGGVVIVYKGAMPNNELVAVNRLPAMSRGFSHNHGFNIEIQTLGRIRHRHIVRLLGFCSNQETNLLVYEYMPKSQVNACT
ncbi:unnamed protein product [Lactuca virosa]|uniref:non-specific serine/threonine protein kinase n=1 Tax=Lactuca virosa TaxID=75947 RepID=A0AAU9LRG6_9ASTR|nr:unnamed protein product [Lactuca virosa]